MTKDNSTGKDKDFYDLGKKMFDRIQPITRGVPQIPQKHSLNRQWVGLTDDEVSEILDDVIGFNSCFGPEESFARAIEAKLKEKNT